MTPTEARAHVLHRLPPALGRGIFVSNLTDDQARDLAAILEYGTAEHDRRGIDPDPAIDPATLTPCAGDCGSPWPHNAHVIPAARARLDDHGGDPLDQPGG